MHVCGTRENIYAGWVGCGHEGDGAYLWVIAYMWDEGSHKDEGEGGGTCG